MKSSLKTIKMGMWLDYEIEANWTTPFIFFVYNIAKPVGASLLLLAMYYVVTGSLMGTTALEFLYVGNAFYMVLSGVMMELGWVVQEDREHYQTLKYIFISPTSYYFYLIGRSAMRFILQLFPLIFLLILGIFINISYQINIFLLSLTVILGWIFMVSAGMVLNSVTLLTARYGGAIGESFAGLFYLVSGVVFPINVLPLYLRNFGLFLPSTYWFSLVRRSILGKEIDPVLSRISMNMCIYLLIITTIMFFVISLALYFLMNYMARKRGTIEMITTY